MAQVDDAPLTPSAPAPPATRRRRLPLSRPQLVVAALCWLIAAGIGVFQLLRLFGLDTHSTRLIAISTAWPLLVLPGLLVIAGAAYVRRLELVAVAAVMLLVVGAAWWPAWTGRVGPGPADASRLRVLALNVQYSSDTGAAVTRQIRATDPDIIVLSELSPLTLQHLDIGQYRYSWQRPHDDAFGQGVYSRWPITDRSVWTLGRLSMIRMTIRLPSGPLRLYQVHTVAPKGRDGQPRWNAQLKQLRRSLSAEKLPVIAAGDFNASHWDAPFRELLGGPSHIADAGAGRGYEATWPSGHGWLPLVYPLDHVLISGGMGVRGYRVLGPVGSDHRGVLADVTLPVGAGSS